MTIPRCISTLGLRPSDIEHLQSGQMLEDTHMMAAQNLIQQQFPQLQGYQSTLLCQKKQFVPVNGMEMVSLKYLHTPMIRVPTRLSLKLFRFFTMDTTTGLQ